MPAFERLTIRREGVRECCHPKVKPESDVATRETVDMTFGQPTGPPASANKVRELLTLLQDAGHTDFRDARGPMGFTQRQAGGKFTRDEVDAFIEQ